MLQDEQAAELLARCENILGHELINIRGELAKAQGRAGAVWELLSIEAASEIGALEHAPDEGSRPDICLRIHSSQPIYIEVTFLHERFAENYRKERQVDEWLKEEARKRNISQSKVTCTFSLDKNHSRVLPDQHEKKIFLQQPEVQKFFGYISQEPSEGHAVSLGAYTISLAYNSKAKEPHRFSGGGPIEEAPSKIDDHALFRKLKSKARQHRLNHPLVICIGSDSSPVLSSIMAQSPSIPSEGEVVGELFSQSKSVSAVLIVSIHNVPGITEVQKVVRPRIWINDLARHPLSKKEVRALQGLNFGRWSYWDHIKQWETDVVKKDQRLSCGCTITTKAGGHMEVGIPADILLDCLAGKTSVEECINNETIFAKCTEKEARIIGCRFVDGNVEVGEGPKVILEYGDRFQSVYYPPKENLR